MENNRTYHIIGAGIAGLYTAKLIKEKYPLSTILLYEAAQKIGGRCGSYFDTDFNCDIDYAPHVILNKNKLARQILGKSAFKYPIKFWSLPQNKITPCCLHLKEILLAVFNTFNPPYSCLFFLGQKLFPFINLKAYFSTGTLQNDICDSLLPYANDIKYSYIWQGIQTKNNRITQLLFNQQTINLTEHDIIISAIDSFNYHKIMGRYDFEYSPITNVFYRTSMALTLPYHLKMIGICDGLSQWLFCHDAYATVTLSHYSEQPDVRQIWQEICAIRHYNSAFLPHYKTHIFPRATIKQDKINNSKRPSSAHTEFDNLFICGDWTMKNQPCCIETALQSARRVVKTIQYYAEKN